jgi:uroporphyrinogen decarboxylase
MNSRERVLTALAHQRPDRPPLNYFGTPETTRMLLDHLKLESPEALLRYFGADMRYVGPKYVGPPRFCGASGFGVGGEDMWGIVWKPIRNAFCTYYETSNAPLAGARSIRDLEAYAWPDPDWLSVDHLRKQIGEIQRDEPRAIVIATGSYFEQAWYLRGFESFLADLAEEPEMAAWLMEKTTSFYETVTRRAVEAAEGLIDIVWSSGDVGMQSGMLVSPAVWREQMKPFHRRLVEPFKKMGLWTRYHTDGSVEPIIEDLIELGIDLLDPIQPDTPGMEPENLAARFGGRISFYGGLDTQHLLPYGTPAEVEAGMLRLIRVLGANGGYVAAASNAVQPDVPVANILALYRTAREYRY